MTKKRCKKMIFNGVDIGKDKIEAVNNDEIEIYFKDLENVFILVIIVFFQTQIALKLMKLLILQNIYWDTSFSYKDSSLLFYLDESPNYYTFDRNEIDFVIQRKNKIIPIEVKSDKSTNHNSLTKYNLKNDNEISFRFSLNNLSKDGKIINIPLYFIEYIDKLNLDQKHQKFKILKKQISSNRTIYFYL